MINLKNIYPYINIYEYVYFIVSYCFIFYVICIMFGILEGSIIIFNGNEHMSIFQFSYQQTQETSIVPSIYGVLLIKAINGFGFIIPGSFFFYLHLISIFFLTNTSLQHYVQLVCKICLLIFILYIY